MRTLKQTARWEENYMTLYRDTIKRAFTIAWQYKFLWFFGLFATVVGSGGEIGFLINSVNDLTSQTSDAGTLQSLLIIKAWIIAFGNILSLPFLTIVSLAGLLLFFMAIIWLVFTSIGGIIGGTAAIEQGKRQTADHVWKVGIKNFIPVLGVNIAAKIIMMILLLVGLPLVLGGLSETNIKGAALFVLYFVIIFLPAIFIISFITKYAMAYIVIRNKPFDQAIASAVKLFRDNWLVSIEMALTVFGVYIVAGLTYIIISGIITYTFKIVSLVGYTIIPSALGWTIVSTTLAFLMYGAVLLLLGSFLAVIEYVAWTKLFLKIEEGKATSKILRLAGALPKYLR